MNTEITQDLKSKTNMDHLLDLEKPLFYQLWTMDLKKDRYLEKIHRPRYRKEPAIFFENSINASTSLNVKLVLLPSMIQMLDILGLKIR